jgi:hypothetical protein
MGFWREDALPGLSKAQTTKELQGLQVMAVACMFGAGSLGAAVAIKN